MKLYLEQAPVNDLDVYSVILERIGRDAKPYTVSLGYYRGHSSAVMALEGHSRAMDVPIENFGM